METHEPPTIVDRVRQIEAKEQIRDLIARYSRGIDRVDLEVAQPLFWPEGRLLVEGFEGPAHILLERLMACEVGRDLAATHHLMGNSIVTLSGDLAQAETYAIAHHRSHPTRASNMAMIGADNLPDDNADAEMAILIGLRYLDELERRGDEWRILERRLVFDWSDAGPYRGIEEGGLYQVTLLRGARGDADPSLQLFAPISSESRRTELIQ